METSSKLLESALALQAPKALKFVLANSGIDELSCCFAVNYHITCGIVRAAEAVTAAAAAAAAAAAPALPAGWALALSRHNPLVMHSKFQ